MPCFALGPDKPRGTRALWRCQRHPAASQDRPGGAQLPVAAQAAPAVAREVVDQSHIDHQVAFACEVDHGCGSPSLSFSELRLTVTRLLADGGEITALAHGFTGGKNVH